jgi:hypothetical protein
VIKEPFFFSFFVLLLFGQLEASLSTYMLLTVSIIWKPTDLDSANATAPAESSTNIRQCLSPDTADEIVFFPFYKTCTPISFAAQESYFQGYLNRSQVLRAPFPESTINSRQAPSFHIYNLYRITRSRWFPSKELTMQDCLDPQCITCFPEIPYTEYFNLRPPSSPSFMETASAVANMNLPSPTVVYTDVLNMGNFLTSPFNPNPTVIGGSTNGGYPECRALSFNRFGQIYVTDLENPQGEPMPLPGVPSIFSPDPSPPPPGIPELQKMFPNGTVNVLSRIGSCPDGKATCDESEVVTGNIPISAVIMTGLMTALLAAAGLVIARAVRAFREGNKRMEAESYLEHVEGRFGIVILDETGQRVRSLRGMQLRRVGGGEIEGGAGERQGEVVELTPVDGSGGSGGGGAGLTPHPRLPPYAYNPERQSQYPPPGARGGEAAVSTTTGSPPSSSAGTSPAAEQPGSLMGMSVTAAMAR